MVAAAGGAPAVKTRTLRGAARRSSAGALAIAMSTVGAAHNMVPRSLAIVSNTVAGSTRRTQMCVPPTAVTIQTKVHPLAWNMGSVQT